MLHNNGLLYNISISWLIVVFKNFIAKTNEYILANPIGPVWGAVFNLRGLQPTGPVSNMVIFMSNTAASIGVLIALGITIRGSIKKTKESK